jgi:ribosomal protein L35
MLRQRQLQPAAAAVSSLLISPKQVLRVVGSPFQQQLLPLNTTTGSSSILCRYKHTLKTIKSVAKRFRVRGNGSLKRSKSGVQHNTGYRSRGSINKLGQSAPILNKKMERKMKICMGVK